MQIIISVTGGEEGAARFNRFAQEIVPKVSQAVAMGGELVEGEAKSLSPVDTGALRESITSMPKGMSCDIGTNVEYGIYQEFGTYKMAAHPYLVPGLINKSPEVIDLIRAALSS